MSEHAETLEIPCAKVDWGTLSHHDLVIGGSGMLAGLCVHLADRGRTVSVVARDRAKLERLAARVQDGPGRIVPWSVDYADATAFRRALTEAINRYGAPCRTICWIHEPRAPNATFEVLPLIHGAFWHILGSGADPEHSVALARWRRRIQQANSEIDYRQILLGFVKLPGNRSRWLSNREISAGVGAALRTSARLTTIGTTQPWSARP